MKRFKPWLILLIFTLAGMLLGYWLRSISLFTGIGFALGIGYGLILRKDA